MARSQWIHRQRQSPAQVSGNQGIGLALFDLTDTPYEFYMSFTGIPDARAARGLITTNTIGFNLQWHQEEPFDLDGSFVDVFCYDNIAQDIAWQDIPLPDISDIVEDLQNSLGQGG